MLYTRLDETVFIKINEIANLVLTYNKDTLGKEDIKLAIIEEFKLV